MLNRRYHVHCTYKSVACTCLTVSAFRINSSQSGNWFLNRVKRIRLFSEKLHFFSILDLMAYKSENAKLCKNAILVFDVGHYQLCTRLFNFIVYTRFVVSKNVRSDRSEFFWLWGLKKILNVFSSIWQFDNMVLLLCFDSWKQNHSDKCIGKRWEENCEWNGFCRVFSVTGKNKIKSSHSSRNINWRKYSKQELEWLELKFKRNGKISRVLFS